MTDPNTPTQSDILAARERAKAKIHPAHWPEIDAGRFDPWRLVQDELAQLIREREEEECRE